MVDRIQPQTITAATYTVTAENNQGSVIWLNRAAGITVTLPAATGSGSVFEFRLATAVTSNSTIIKVNNSTDVFTGIAIVASAADNTNVVWETAAASDTLTLNGTTTAGLKGDYFVVKDVAAGNYAVNFQGAGSGTLATVWSATV